MLPGTYLGENVFMYNVCMNTLICINLCLASKYVCNYVCLYVCVN